MQKKIIALLSNIEQIKHELGITDYNLDRGHNDYFLNERTGERYPYEMRSIMLPGSTYQHKDQRVVYVRMKSLFLLDHEYALKLSTWPSLSLLIHRTIKDDLICKNHIRYSSLAIASLLHTDLRNKYVLDLGAGDGLLSLVAHQLGATHILAVECDHRMQEKFDLLLRMNSVLFSEKRRSITWHTGNLTDLKRPSLRAQGAFKTNVIIANLGPHYKDAHTNAIRLIDLLPLCDTFIGGGYEVLARTKLRSKLDLDLSPDLALAMLQERGFEYIERITWSTPHIKLLSFIARKHKTPPFCFPV